MGIILRQAASNYFQLFGQQPQYRLDLSQLKRSFIELQQQVHPDNFASFSEEERAQAERYASYVNEAYKVLSSPVERAQYLLELAGQPNQMDSETTDDIAFLTQQMSLREQVFEADDVDELEDISDAAHDGYAQLQNQYDNAYQTQDWVTARSLLHKLMFSAKLIRSIEEKFDHIGA